MQNLMMNQRVMVAYVSTEVIKVTEPAKLMKIDKIHLINYIKEVEPDDERRQIRKSVYEKVYNRNIEIFQEEKIEVVPHRDVPVFEFDECFHAVYEILINERKKGSYICVNISSGPPDYVAAASIASMMVEGVEIFTVGTNIDGFTIPIEKLEDSLRDDNNQLVGTAFKINDPIRIDRFPLPTPDLTLLKALNVFASVPENKRSNVNVIRELIKKQAWKCSSSNENRMIGTSVELEDEYGNLIDNGNINDYSRLQRKEAVQYQRSYIDRWKEEGWIEKSEINGKRYRISKKGERYLRIFIMDDD